MDGLPTHLAGYSRYTMPLLCGLLMMVGSCKTDIPVEDILPKQPTISEVTPNPAKAGDTLKIIGSEFDSVYYKNTIWIGTTSLFPNAGNRTDLSVRLPFGILSGLVSVRTPAAIADGPTLTILPHGSSMVSLGWYTGPSITDTSSWVIGAGCDNIFHKWNLTQSGDTVTLILSFCYGDDSSVRKTIKLRHAGNNQLPLYLSGEWYQRPFPSSWTETLRGYIAIEQWNIPGTVSGRVSAYIDHWSEWADFNFHCTVL